MADNSKMGLANGVTTYQQQPGYIWGDGEAGAMDQDQGYVWGGSNDAADNDVNRYRSLGAAAMQRQAPQADYGGANYAAGQGTYLLDQDQSAMNAQMHGANLYANAMNGGAPSAAQIQAQSAQGANLQSLLQANASGHTGLANAAMGRAGLGAYGAASAANVGQLGAARANEVLTDRSGYGQNLAQQRAGDYGMSQAATNLGGTQGQMATFNGQMTLNQEQQNQQYQQQMETLAQGVRQAQLTAAQQTEARKIGLVGYKSEADAAENAATMSLGGSAASGVGNALATYAKSNYGSGSSDSDTRVKEAAWDVMPLYEPEGQQLHQGDDGRAFFQSNPQEQTIGGGQPLPSIASSPRVTQDEKKVAQAAAHPAQKHVMSYDELMKWADGQIAETNAAKERSLAQGPAVQSALQATPSSVYTPDQGVLADANRKMAGSPYRYKAEFTPPDEVPGQIHHGFMAQNLEQNPVTATAVQKDANGVRQVHHARMLQAVASGLSDLQRQVDETRMAQKGGR